MGIDLNDSPGQEVGGKAQPGKAARADEIQEIKAALEAQLGRVLFHLLPKGAMHGGKFYVGSVRGEPGKSLDIPLSGNLKGMWKDFASNEGGDIIKLWQAVRGLSFRDTMDEIRAYLGKPNRFQAKAAVLPKLPPAAEVAPAKSNHRPALPAPTKVWHYYDESGNILGSQTRYDMLDGSKEFRPYCAVQKKSTFPIPRPLYNLPGIVQADTVYIVEGEKCADAINKRGVGVATTLMGGANTPTAKVDFEPLRGKHAIVWPDNDEPGHKYAENIVRALSGIAQSVRVVLVPEGLPAKWDVADALEDPGFDFDQFVGEHTMEWVEPEPEPPPRPRFDPEAWRADERFAGEPPKIKWSVRNIFQESSVAILAAQGDSGKGMLSLDLALKVTSPGWGDQTT
jgi:hypothetical protein